MRITGGTLARINIKVPKRDVRPTTDMVREALFSIIASRIPNASVLDLFAGSGVIGIEAFSRGASKICGVESERYVLKVLKENINKLKVDNYKIIAGNVITTLKRGFAGDKFDIIFADPPYWWEQEQVAQLTGEGRQGNNGEIPRLVRDSDCLYDNGLLIVERAAKDKPTKCEGWKLIDHRIYGGTGLTFYELTNRTEQKLCHGCTNKKGIIS